MGHPTLFHLHFNTPAVERAAARLEQVGVPLTRRFGTLDGESHSLTPDADVPDGFRFKLQVHRRGAVDITLAPGRRSHFDHLGLFVPDLDETIDRAEAAGFSVRPNSRWTFVMTPWRFRVELHSSDGAVTAAHDDGPDSRLADAILTLPEAGTARETFASVFGDVPALTIESGDGPWLESFAIATGREETTVAARELLES